MFSGEMAMRSDKLRVAYAIFGHFGPILGEALRPSLIEPLLQKQHYTLFI